MIDLKDVSTADLARELAGREGVDSIDIPLGNSGCIENVGLAITPKWIKGPATIIVVRSERE